ncbi:hypothetical protein LguiB_006261 [Lonicera macranthoides]
MGPPHLSLGISRSYRDILPAHIIFKIESFSELLNSNSEKYQSDVFEAMGYNWRVTLYPRGRSKGGDKDHLAVCLEIVDTHKFIHNWEVYVNYKLFVYDYLMDSYYTIQDVDGKVRRFHSMVTEWGFDKFISLETLMDDSNGYIKGDSCVFGAEVFIIKHSTMKSPSIRDETNTDLFTWKIEKFSSLKDQKYCSNIFVIGGYTWNLLFYPKGNLMAGYSSLFLETDSVVQNPNRRLYAEFKLRIKSQLKSTIEEHTTSNCFCSSEKSWGFSQFISLENLNDTSKGFQVNDSIILEVEIIALSLVKE